MKKKKKTIRHKELPLLLDTDDIDGEVKLAKAVLAKAVADIGYPQIIGIQYMSKRGRELAQKHNYWIRGARNFLYSTLPQWVAARNFWQELATNAYNDFSLPQDHGAPPEDCTKDEKSY